MRMRGLTFLVTMLAACSNATNPTSVVVKVSVAPATFRGGDTLTVMIDITNASQSAVTINVKDCPYSFVVYNKSGEVVAPGRHDCFGDAQMKILHPGETHTLVNKWNGELFRPTPGSMPLYLPAGQYRLEARVTIPGEVAISETLIEIR